MTEFQLTILRENREKSIAFDDDKNAISRRRPDKIIRDKRDNEDFLVPLTSVSPPSIEIFTWRVYILSVNVSDYLAVVIPQV